MARIGIVTDSTAHVPHDLVEKYHLHIADLAVLFGTQSIRERDLTTDEFFRRLKESRTLPTSSQPSPDEFLRVFREAAAGNDSVIAAIMSHKISGTINSARLAAKMVEDEGGPRVTVIDTLSAWMGTGLMAIKAAQAAQDGKTHEQVVDLVESLVPRMQVMLVVDTLEYLQRGGRIGGASALIGTMLQIKPLLSFRDGAIQPLERVRTKRRALDRMLELMVEHVGKQPYTAVVGHTMVEAEATQMRAAVLARMPQARQIYVGPVSPVVAVHLGPGALGLVYYVHKPGEA